MVPPVPTVNNSRNTSTATADTFIDFWYCCCYWYYWPLEPLVLQLLALSLLVPWPLGVQPFKVLRLKFKIRRKRGENRGEKWVKSLIYLK